MVALPAQDPTANLSPAVIEALLNGPAAPPPNAAAALNKDRSNFHPIVITVVTLCHFFAALAIIIRLYTKVFLIRSTGLEDYSILVAWVGLIGFTVPSIHNFNSGGGVHMWYIKLKDFYSLLYSLNVAVIIYGIVVFFIKLSILLQYLRIFVPTRKPNMGLYITIHSIMWISGLFYLAETIVWIFECSPREKIWKPLVPGRCLDIHSLFMISGVFNVISDVAILVVPMVPILKLQMPFRKKIVMLAVFATGLFACIVSIIRTISTWRAITTTDSSYYVVITGLWTWAELTTGIVISCFPVMPKFFVHFSPKARKIFSNITRSSQTSNSKPHSVQKPKGNDSQRRPLCASKWSADASVNDPRDLDGIKDVQITLDELETSSSKAGTTPKRLSRVSREECNSAV